MEYRFEKMYDEEMYQVKLNGEFVTYTSHPKPEVIDKILFNRGYKSREEFYEELLNRRV